MTEPDPDHVPTLRFTVQCIRDDQIDGVYDDLTGPEAAEHIATLIDEAIERKTCEPPWSDEDWKPWLAGLHRALREASRDPSAPTYNLTSALPDAHLAPRCPGVENTTRPWLGDGAFSGPHQAVSGVWRRVGKD